jgi:type II secretory pathway component PulK
MKTSGSTRRRTGQNGSSRAGNRRGGVLLIGLVILVVIMIIEGVLIRASVSRRQQFARDELRVQAEWLVQSGLSRARARLAQSDAYTGESWAVSSDDLNGRDAASVRVDVETPQARPDERHVRITVDLPTEGLRRTRDEQRFLIHTGRKAVGDAR